MTQETGTQILARARIYAQDNDANSNYAVSDASALILLNDILVSLSNNVRVKPKWVGASVSGLSFAAGNSSKVTTADINATEIESFHQSNAAAFSAPASPALERISVQQILTLFNFDGNTALSQAASTWTHVAAEKAQDLTAAGVEVWRVWAYPVINTTRHIHLRVPAPVTISALTSTPDLDTVDSRVVSRLLGYDMAKLKKESSQEFLQNIIRSVPQDVLQVVYGGAVRASQLQDHVIQRND